jgi:hypothetical protein
VSSARKSNVIACLILLSAVVPGGCRTAHRLEVTETGAPRYGRVEIDYELQDLPDRNDRSFLQTIRPVSAASYGGAVAGAAEWSTARLSIQYPIPDGHPDFARLRLELKPASAVRATSEPAAEVRTLDVPKQELDLLIADLAHQGYFGAAARSEGGARLNVSIDQGRAQKTWSSEPRLDDLAERVYREGRLASGTDDSGPLQ